MTFAKDYQQVIAFLDALQMHKIKLGLDAIGQFLDRVGNPQESLVFVHIAGTNGKGTVCAALKEILCRSGYKVGVYTSPHLDFVRERFAICGNNISEADFARLGGRIINALDGETITYFEFVTVLALLFFAESEVDLVLLETGMGGRLDATNVVTPVACVITSISIDHQAWLGESLAEIAAEKAGIIKPGVPVVSAAAGDAATVIAQKAADCRAPLFRLHHEFDYMPQDDSWSWQGKGFGRDINGLVSGSVSLAQQENEALALAVLPLLGRHGFRVADTQIRSALSALVWPGRMEQISVKRAGKRLTFLLDGAHNRAGVANLAATIQKHFPQRRLAIWGSMADKDLSGMLTEIEGLFAALFLTKVEGDRSAEPAAILAALPLQARGQALSLPDISQALAQAVDMADESDLIVVAGSLYLVGAIRSLLLREESC